MPSNLGPYQPYTGFNTAYQTNTLWAWGDNLYGQIGNGTSGISYSSPIQIGSLTNWKTIAFGQYHGIGIQTDGSLWTWGLNTWGNLGNGTNNINYSSPIQVGSLTTWNQVAGLGFHTTAAIKTDGTLWTWGYGGQGQLGNGNITHYSSPIQIGALTNWKQVAGGRLHMGAVKTDGTLWTWGSNNYGQLANGTIINYSSPVQVGSLTNWNQIACGYGNVAAIKTDNTLWVWGYNTYGQLGNGNIINYSSPIQVGSLTNWKQVICGKFHFAAIKSDGTLWTCGYNQYGQLGNNSVGNLYSSPVQVGSLTNWSQVACGYRHTAAIKTDGTLWNCGYSSSGQLGNGTIITYSSPVQIGSLSNWSLVACAALDTSAIQTYNYNQDLGQRYTTKSYLLDVYPNIASQIGARTSPGLFVWGSGSYGMLGNGTVNIGYSSPIQIGTLTNWKQIAGGLFHTAAVTTTGQMWTWGRNQAGNLGNGNIIDYSSPIQVGALTNWKQVSAGYNWTASIKTDGTLWAWGAANGVLGNGTIIQYSSPIQIGALTNWKQISCGYQFTAAVKTDGTLWSWGSNNFGQLGNGSINNYSSPIQIGALTNWKQVSAGKYHIAAVKTDGTLWTCGYSLAGRLGNGVASILINYSSPVQVGALTNWKQVSCGYQHTAAVKTDGTIWTWGSNGYGQLAYTFYDFWQTNVSSPIQVAGGTSWSSVDANTVILSNLTNSPQSAFIGSNGSLWTWGLNQFGALGNGNIISYSSPIQVGALTNWKQVTGGFKFTAATQTNGTLWTCGYNRYGQLGNGTGVYYSSPIQVGALTDWKQVSAGYLHAAAIKTDGTLWNWGYNTSGQLGNGNVINYSSPIQVGALTNWSQVACGQYHTASIKTDGTLWIWGYNNQGQLGNGTININYSSPLQIGALTNWKQVACGQYHTASIKTDGTLWIWGYNNTGQLGNVTVNISYSSPIQVGSLTNWKQVACGQYHTASIKTDGTLWAWGYNNFGPLGNGNVINYSSPIQVGSLSNWTQVVCGQNNIFTYSSIGTLWGCGYNSAGQLGGKFAYATAASSPVQVGTLTNWKQVSAGSTHTSSIKTDGTLWGFGSGDYIGNGTIDLYSSPIQVGTITNWKLVSGYPGNPGAISDGYI